MQKLHLLPPSKVANELLLIDSYTLRKILPEELDNESWLGEKKTALSPNITAMVDHFNSLALLIPTEVLAEETPETRAKVISAFIKIAKACHQLRNYHSLKAVLAGLQCTPVYRLKRTWKRVPGSRMKTFHKLYSLMAEEGNCALYHNEISKNINNNTPFVPYLGFFLTQIVHQACYRELKGRKVMKRQKAMLKKYKVYSSLTISRNVVCEKLESLLNYSISDPGECKNQTEDYVIHDTTNDFCDSNKKKFISASCDNLVSAESSSTGGDCIKQCIIVTDFSILDPEISVVENSISCCYTPPTPTSGNCSPVSEFTGSSCSSLLRPLDNYITESLNFRGYSNNSGQETAPNVDSSPENQQYGFQPLSSTCSRSDTALDRIHGGAIHGSSTLLPQRNCQSLCPSRAGSTSTSRSGSSSHLYLHHSGRTGGYTALSTTGSPRYRSDSDDEEQLSCTFQTLVTLSNTFAEIDDGTRGAAEISNNTRAGALLDCESETTTREEPSGEDQQEFYADCPFAEGGGGAVLQESVHSLDDCPTCAKRNGLFDCRRKGVQLDTRDPGHCSDPKALLQRYQLWSLGCAVGLKQKGEIKRLLGNYQCNSESENYTLSYHREPQLRKQASDSCVSFAIKDQLKMRMSHTLQIPKRIAEKKETTAWT